SQICFWELNQHALRDKETTRIEYLKTLTELRDQLQAALYDNTHIGSGYSGKCVLHLFVFLILASDMSPLIVISFLTTCSCFHCSFRLHILVLSSLMLSETRKDRVGLALFYHH